MLLNRRCPFNIWYIRATCSYWFRYVICVQLFKMILQLQWRCFHWVAMRKSCCASLLHELLLGPSWPLRPDQNDHVVLHTSYCERRHQSRLLAPILVASLSIIVIRWSRGIPLQWCSCLCLRVLPHSTALICLSVKGFFSLRNVPLSIDCNRLIIPFLHCHGLGSDFWESLPKCGV